MRSFGILLLALACLINLASSHTDSKNKRDVPCKFINDDRGYVCEIENLKLYEQDDWLRFTGEQLKGMNNEEVTYLHIRSSETYHVPSENIFSYFTNLVNLEMKGVSVKRLDPIVNCFPLVKIILSENKIKLIDAGVFIDCEHLEILDLSKNEIEKIHDNAFGSLNTLEVLDLSNNKITKLTRKIIKAVKNLKKLSLNSNLLKEFSHDTFNDMFHLTELDLSNNPLKRLDFRSFDFTIHIQRLHLRETEIKKFHPFTFKNLRRLEFIDISNNNFNHLKNDLLSTNGELLEVRMDKIGMRAMGRQFFDKLNKLRLISANENKCVDGVFRGDVVQIRPNFLKCFDAWDLIRENSESFLHSGEEL